MHSECFDFHCSVITPRGLNPSITNCWCTYQSVSTLKTGYSEWRWTLHCLTGFAGTGKWDDIEHITMLHVHSTELKCSSWGYKYQYGGRYAITRQMDTHDSTSCQDLCFADRVWMTPTEHAWYSIRVSISSLHWVICSIIVVTSHSSEDNAAFQPPG